MFGSDPLLYPTLDPAMQSFIRVAYGILQLLTLLSAVPHARRYFLTDRWGGYAQSSRWTDAVQNPIVSPVLLAVWIGTAIALIAGWWVVPAAAVNLLLCHYFFIRMRWRAVLRGMGAPGFIAYWLGAAVFFLELTARHAPALHGVALFALQVDFALIMVTAGLYKLAAGYRAGAGMELGMANPEWGYWAARWRHWPPRHVLFTVLDEMAWGTEVFAGLLMLVPATRFIGGMAMLLSFAFIATQIRLGFLCEMVMVCCLIFVPASFGHAGGVAAGPLLPGAAQMALAVFFWGYLALLPVARAAMFYNQLAHRALPAPLQRALDIYTNWFGLILWRVFSADVTNFFVRIWEERSGSTRRLVTEFEGFPWTRRFRQVAECIALTSIFTTRRYYPSNRALFDERLLRYARTIPHAPGSRLVFEWVNVARAADRFDFVPAAEYSVDVNAGVIEELTLSHTVRVDAPAAGSPVHEGVRPGSYVPLSR
ncbi:MAG TPA: hypothetical protein VGQ16_17815 [Vicinamibacterales bacterium]|jgi:hypothetical protein|nr:hypothetical protein [Vicinamibacterales bacterium]